MITQDTPKTPFLAPQFKICLIVNGCKMHHAEELFRIFARRNSALHIMCAHRAVEY